MISILISSNFQAHSADSKGDFKVEEATISDVHAAMKSGKLTAHRLVEMYLARIDAFDKKGPTLNAIISINPNALTTADALDAAFKQSGPVGPLYGIPVLLKDNVDTDDMPTTAGSKRLEGCSGVGCNDRQETQSSRSHRRRQNEPPRVCDLG
jgi:amidase